MSRRRWIYTEGGKPLPEPIEVDLTQPPTYQPRVELMTGSFYEGARATDGTPIDTRRRHRDYLKATGSAMASDYTKTFERARQEREAKLLGEHRTKQARAATAAAWHEVTKD